jgi:ABC-2 type transport system ATP-binding protein
VRIGGLDPQKERKRVVQDLGVVFGQRTQLYWDLRLGESFELLKRIYRVPDAAYRGVLDEMNQLLQINEIIDTPVRQLSLGQRMRGDLAAAMLHSPATVFLDEPTIGLDIDAKQAIRRFIREINAARGATVILTTHDLDDIQELCSRIIVLGHGRIIEDGNLREIIDKIAPVRRLTVDLERPPEDPQALEQPPARVVKQEGTRVVYEFPKAEIAAPALIAALSQKLPVRDISLEEADIEDIIQRVYQQ